jgi:predicted CXXCH cytochrome family protein
MFMVSLKKSNKRESIFQIRFEMGFLLILILVSLLFLAACSTLTKHEVLSFFFDGVSSPMEKPQIKSDSLIKKDTIISSQLVQIQDVPIFVHSPDCSDCHETASLRNLKLKQPDLCYNCHEDFHKKFKFLHGPVEGGYCMACHRPHLSENKKLLIRIGNEICLHCHNKVDLIHNKVHQEIESNICTDCHNPHGGSNKLLIN